MAATRLRRAAAAERFAPGAERPLAPSSHAVLAKAGRENFPVALLVLSRSTRRHLLAVYGFARLVDDAGDEALGSREALLDAIDGDLDRVYRGEPHHPLMQRLAETVRELKLPREPFERLIEANRQDQRISRYETYDELAGYCELSANPVGRLVLHVFGAATRERVAWSDSVCTGLQLAEHWQDVGEDFRRGRVYLPQDDLRRFAVTEADLGRRRATPALRRLMEFEVERARHLLADGRPLVASLSGQARLAVAAYVGGGLAALAAVEHAGYEVLGGPPRARTPAKALWTLRTLWEAG
ncbi:MAG: squalene synthase HpnC [Actinomycetota bacterium]|nr:squalene synthase HpnC [Actinomycetota bacterium]